RPDAGDGGHDLEHRARDVLALGRPGQERLRAVVEDGGERVPRRLRVGDRVRVVRRGRGEGEDLAGRRVEHDDGAPIVAQAVDGRLLEGGRDAQGQLLRVIRI